MFDVDVPVMDFSGFEVKDFTRMFCAGGEELLSEEVQSWLDMDEGDPGHELLSEEEIIQSVLQPAEEEKDDSDEKENSTNFTIKLSTAHEYLDHLINLVDARPRDFNIVDYDHLRGIRRKVIELQYTAGKQTSITLFFRSRTPTPTTTPGTSPEPSTSGLQQPFLSGSSFEPSTSGIQQPFASLETDEDSE